MSFFSWRLVFCVWKHSLHSCCFSQKTPASFLFSVGWSPENNPAAIDGVVWSLPFFLPLCGTVAVDVPNLARACVISSSPSTSMWRNCTNVLRWPFDSIPEPFPPRMSLVDFFSQACSISSGTGFDKWKQHGSVLVPGYSNGLKVHAGEIPNGHKDEPFQSSPWVEKHFGWQASVALGRTLRQGHTYRTDFYYSFYPHLLVFIPDSQNWFAHQRHKSPLNLLGNYY